ncbi:Metallo-hydrolase/oxidoreductase [Gonapodya prolifera JEL478]|uniref:Metallo-hydrolase/oxidoreductase n=1 Tax=Gonapodya prolifera (strain JEL478) TaxID=1344416 RepID=A0A139AIL9_GONPJ|nr:Metallo-hydrolase/oxidoreductase [Gonapodya prolifera JEL478]|eukprot:KXS16651.1 Metallo-hydrolase/oxidoreductase [Gonapodya prolifera JEL478]
MAQLKEKQFTITSDLGVFVEIRKDLFRCTQVYTVMASLISIPCCVFLARYSEQKYALVDASHNSNATLLVSAVRSQLAKTSPPGTLTHFLCTHAHRDHIGGLHAILEAYPELRVVAHEEELPFLCDQTPYSTQPADNWTFWFARPLLSTPITSLDRGMVDVVSNGDVILDGAFRVISTPGHTPVLVGDALVHFSLTGSATYSLSGPPILFTPNDAEARRSMVKIASDGEWDTLFAAHDGSGGAVRKDVDEFLRKIGA